MSLKNVLNSSFHRSSSDQSLYNRERPINRSTLNNSSSALSDLSRHERLSFLSWDRLQHWIYGIAVVNFDLKIGHSIEYILNIGGSLTENDKLDISYLSLPDTNAQCTGDLQYHFRLHRERYPTENYAKYNAEVPKTLQVDASSLFGYVNFRQVRDNTSKRGFFQKSIVILSRLPFFSLFTSLAQNLSTIYFQDDQEKFESCLQRMDREWPEIEVGKSLILNVFNQSIQTKIPSRSEKPFSSDDLIPSRMTNQDNSANNQTLKYPIDDDTDFDVSLDASRTMTSNRTNPQIPQLIPFVHYVNTYRALSAVLNHVQLLWELVLVNEPIVILSNFPNSCSQTVQALVHMIWPLHYSSDYRPFWTIHNNESIDLNSGKLNSGRIIGVTNPLFSRILHQWPHLIRLDDYPKSSDTLSTTIKEQFILVDLDDDDDLSVNELEETLEVNISKTNKAEQLNQVQSYSKIYKRSKSIKAPNELRPGLHTSYKQLLNSDKIILKKLFASKAQQRSDAVQNAFLRRFFYELTQSFLNPLERYFSSLLPPESSYKINGEAPQLKTFNQDEFIKSLDQNGPQLTSGLRGSWKDLYKKFFASENFQSWLINRQIDARAKIDVIYLEKMANAVVQEDFHVLELTIAERKDLASKFEAFVERLESADDQIQYHIERNNRNELLEKFKFLIRQINKISSGS